jgi:hypothetical protein
MQAKEDGTDKRSGLGASPEAGAAATTPSAPYKVAGVPPSSGADKASAAETKPAPFVAKSPGKAVEKAADKASSPRLGLVTAGVAGSKAKMLPDTALPPSANQRCRVWTASYGGQKALIIRSVADQVVNFTVLDVNTGSEQREAEAFISAYAKNGKIAGEYANQAQALDKAFELCPEG